METMEDTTCRRRLQSFRIKIEISTGIVFSFKFLQLKHARANLHLQGTGWWKEVGAMILRPSKETIIVIPGAPCGTARL